MVLQCPGHLAEWDTVKQRHQTFTIILRPAKSLPKQGTLAEPAWETKTPSPSTPEPQGTSSSRQGRPLALRGSPPEMG